LVVNLFLMVLWDWNVRKFRFNEGVFF